MAMNIKQEEINILDSRVFADVLHKNDNKKESSLGDTPSLSSLGKSRRDTTRGSINNEYNILDSRVFADATHKNDRKRNADAIHKDDSQVCESDCTTPLSFL